jgi:hypothetical protein
MNGIIQMSRNQTEESTYPELFVLQSHSVQNVKQPLDASHCFSIRELLLDQLTQLVYGDVLLAKYLLCFLLSKA